MGKVHFTPKDILQKDFKQKMRGYDPTDVDSFLDMVIRDYETFDKTVQQLRDENDQLRSRVDQLSSSSTANPNFTESQPNPTPNVNQSSTLNAGNEQPNNATYINILKRLSNLEKHVFGPQANRDHDSHRF